MPMTSLTSVRTLAGRLRLGPHSKLGQRVLERYGRRQPQAAGAAGSARQYAKAGLSPEKRVIVYARGGYQLSHAYTVLGLLGYKDVAFFTGKFEGWKSK